MRILLLLIHIRYLREDRLADEEEVEGDHVRIFQSSHISDSLKVVGRIVVVVLSMFVLS